MTAPVYDPQVAFTPQDPGGDAVDIRDFTISRVGKPFKIDNDVFHAEAIISLPLLQDLVRMSSDIEGLARADNQQPLVTLFNALLTPESGPRFAERLVAKSGPTAIDFKRQIMPLMQWLIGSYGGRPTEPSAE